MNHRYPIYSSISGLLVALTLASCSVQNNTKQEIKIHSNNDSIETVVLNDVPRPSNSATQDSVKQLALENVVHKSIFDYVKELNKQNKNYLVFSVSGGLGGFIEDENSASYFIACFGDSSGEKIRKGDHRTPLGIYTIIDFYISAECGPSFLLSFPNIYNARHGLKIGTISQEVCKRIENAINSNGIPPQTTDLGGMICIHGGNKYGSKDEKFIQFDWSDGCVTLDEYGMEVVSAHVIYKGKLLQGIKVFIMP